MFQTGQYDAPHQQISKRGSPFLRHTLWNMAFQAVYQEGEIRDYWLRKSAEGLKRKAAITAAAIKLCQITWRILTDKRDYLPARRSPQSNLRNLQLSKSKITKFFISYLTAYSWSFLAKRISNCYGTDEGERLAKWNIACVGAKSSRPCFFRQIWYRKAKKIGET